MPTAPLRQTAARLRSRRPRRDRPCGRQRWAPKRASPLCGPASATLRSFSPALKQANRRNHHREVPLVPALVLGALSQSGSSKGVRRRDQKALAAIHRRRDDSRFRSTASLSRRCGRRRAVLPALLPPLSAEGEPLLPRRFLSDSLLLNKKRKERHEFFLVSAAR